MGIFDFLNEKQSRKTNDVKLSNDFFGDLESLKQHNKEWGKEFNHIISLREKAIRLDKELKYNEAIEVYLESIDFGENSTKLNISNYVHDIERVIVLYGKSKQLEKQVDFLKRIINTYPDFQGTDKWKIRLSKLSQENSTKSEYKLTQKEIVELKPSNPTIGKKLQDFKDSLPEFNFYNDMPNGMQTFEYLMIRKPVPFEKSKKLRDFKLKFESILTKAQIAENQEDLKTAIKYYLLLIAEEYEGKEPFERLLIIYRKLKWKDKEIETLRLAISYFEKLKSRQKYNTILLSRKYGMEHMALEYINSNKKIQYYGGAFDLYNPFTIIDKWKEKLEKL